MNDQELFNMLDQVSAGAITDPGRAREILGRAAQRVDELKREAVAHAEDLDRAQRLTFKRRRESRG